MKRKKKFIRKTAPLLLLLAATSTGTILASDPCKVVLVQKFTDAADKAERMTPARRKHTKATLAAWKVWGDAYLAKHGHPFVPPKRNAMLHPKTPREREQSFKFACESFELPLFNETLTAELEPVEVPPFESPVAILTATNVPPSDLPPPAYVLPPSGNTTGVTPVVPFLPVFPPGTPGAGTLVPVIPPDVPPSAPVQPPASVVPEPASFLLLGTGIAGAFGIWKRREREIA